MTPQRFVVDNSVIMAWCFEDEGSEYADAVLASLEDLKWAIAWHRLLLLLQKSSRWIRGVAD